MVALLLCSVKNIDTLTNICFNDADCRFVATRCCPGCDGFDSVNMIAAENIEKGLVFSCEYTQCPAFPCDSPTGEAVIGVPVCLKNRCDVENTVNCRRFCNYADDSQYASYVQKTEEMLGKTSAQLSAECNCP